MQTGALLWVTGAADVNRDLIEESADAFKRGVRFCRRTELATVLRTGQWDLVAVELDGSGGGLEVVRSLALANPRPAIIAATPDSTLDAIRMALDAGADDVIALPVAAPELHKTLLRLTRAGTAPTPAARPAVSGEIVTLCGARGGIGATTVAVNLAFQLATLTSKEVCLVDLDLQRGDVAAFLNLNPTESLATIAAAGGEVDELFLAGALTRHASGIFVLAAPAEIEDADAIGHEDVALTLKLLRAQFRYTVIDTSRTLTGAVLPAYEQSDRVLLLTDLSVPSIRAARRQRDLLGRINVAPTAIDLLVTEAKPGPVSVGDAAGAVGKQPLLLLPRDEATAAHAMNEGTPIESVQSPLRAALTQLAATIANIHVEARPRSGRLLQRLLGGIGGGAGA